MVASCMSTESCSEKVKIAFFYLILYLNNNGASICYCCLGFKSCSRWYVIWYSLLKSILQPSYSIIRWVEKGGVWEAIFSCEENGMQALQSQKPEVVFCIPISPFIPGDLRTSNELLLCKEHGSAVCCLRGRNQLCYRAV
jgi:hypothetical protein